MCFFVVLYIFSRGALPRVRFDQLMVIGWKFFLPISIMYLLITVFFSVLFSSFPV
jgi:NADH-quinone oxidoreductase subunit H